jgi:hypothetical protein
MDIIFGAYNGYIDIKTEKGGIYYFVKSIRQYNHHCKIIILCEKENIFIELKEFCDKYDVFLYNDFNRKYHMMFYRFEIYYEILGKLKGFKINRILISDIDDVIFQSDPFSIAFSQDMYCAAEQNIISDEENWSSYENRLWIKESENLIVFDNENFKNNPVVCAGTILGNYRGIMNFLYFFVDVQSKRTNEKGVNDQGLFNIYIYNYCSIKTIPTYRKSRILTLDNIDFNTLKIKDKKIVNENDEPYAIIHQINRCNINFMKNLVEN